MTQSLRYNWIPIGKYIRYRHKVETYVQINPENYMDNGLFFKSEVQHFKTYKLEGYKLLRKIPIGFLMLEPPNDYEWEFYTRVRETYQSHSN